MAGLSAYKRIAYTYRINTSVMHNYQTNQTHLKHPQQLSIYRFPFYTAQENDARKSRLHTRRTWWLFVPWPHNVHVPWQHGRRTFDIQQQLWCQSGPLVGRRRRRRNRRHAEQQSRSRWLRPLIQCESLDVVVVALHGRPIVQPVSGH